MTTVAFFALFFSLKTLFSKHTNKKLKWAHVRFPPKIYCDADNARPTLYVCSPTPVERNSAENSKLKLLER